MPTRRAAPGGETIELLLALVCRLHHARAHALFEKLGLYRGQLRLLRQLWEADGPTQAELARALHVKSATATRMVQRMERAGFVSRRPDPRDRRLSRVYLTSAGRGVRARVRVALGRLEALAVQGLSAPELRLLARLLGEVRDNLMVEGRPARGGRRS